MSHCIVLLLYWSPCLSPVKHLIIMIFGQIMFI